MFDDVPALFKETTGEPIRPRSFVVRELFYSRQNLVLGESTGALCNKVPSCTSDSTLLVTEGRSQQGSCATGTGGSLVPEDHSQQGTKARSKTSSWT